MPRDFELYADPYIAAMKRYERSSLRYIVIAMIAMVASLIVSAGDEKAAGIYVPLIANANYIVGAGLLIGSCVASLLAAWAIGHRVYFSYWPERF